MNPLIGDGDSFTLADVISYSIATTNGGTSLFVFTDANRSLYASAFDTKIAGFRSGNDLVFTNFALATSDNYFGVASFTADLTFEDDTVYDDDGDFVGIFNNTEADLNGFYVRFPNTAVHQSSYRATVSGNVVPEPASLSIFACGAVGLMLRRRRSPA